MQEWEILKKGWIEKVDRSWKIGTISPDGIAGGRKEYRRKKRTVWAKVEVGKQGGCLQANEQNFWLKWKAVKSKPENIG